MIWFWWYTIVTFNEKEALFAISNGLTTIVSFFYKNSEYLIMKVNRRKIKREELLVFSDNVNDKENLTMIFADLQQREVHYNSLCG